MSYTLGDLYQSLFKEYRLHYCNDSVATAQSKLNERCASTVRMEKKEDRVMTAKILLQEMQQKTTKQKAKNLLNYFQVLTNFITI